MVTRMSGCRRKTQSRWTTPVPMRISASSRVRAMAASSSTPTPSSIRRSAFSQNSDTVQHSGSGVYAPKSSFANGTEFQMKAARRQTAAFAAMFPIDKGCDGGVAPEPSATISRRIFISALAAGGTGALLPRLARAEADRGARNIVLLHALFSDGSCWSEAIARLQEAGLNATSVQTPLTTLDDAVAATQRALARPTGPP